MSDRPSDAQQFNKRPGALAGALDQLRTMIQRGLLVAVSGRRHNPHSRVFTKRYADGRPQVQAPAATAARKTCSGPSEHVVMRRAGLAGPAFKTKARQRWEKQERLAKQKSRPIKAR
jgi:hypothetical protein